MIKSINVWICVNKNGFVNMFNSNPIRNNESGKWESSSIFVNSEFYKEVLNMIKKTKMTWENEPEFFELTMKG